MLGVVWCSRGYAVYVRNRSTAMTQRSTAGRAAHTQPELGGVPSPNEIVSAADVQGCIDLLARYLEEAHTGNYAR
jgi:hypothetical protein